jgi:hypothetical protein
MYIHNENHVQQGIINESWEEGRGLGGGRRRKRSDDNKERGLLSRKRIIPWLFYASLRLVGGHLGPPFAFVLRRGDKRPF